MSNRQPGEIEHDDRCAILAFANRLLHPQSNGDLTASAQHSNDHLIPGSHRIHQAHCLVRCLQTRPVDRRHDVAVPQTDQAQRVAPPEAARLVSDETGIIEDDVRMDAESLPAVKMPNRDGFTLAWAP